MGSMNQRTMFKVGDVVKVKEDLKPNRTYYMKSGINATALDGHTAKRGELVEISRLVKFNNRYYYEIKEDRGEFLPWTDEMFSGFATNLD